MLVLLSYAMRTYITKRKNENLTKKGKKGKNGRKRDPHKMNQQSLSRKQRHVH